MVVPVDAREAPQAAPSHPLCERQVHVTDHHGAGKRGAAFWRIPTLQNESLQKEVALYG